MTNKHDADDKDKPKESMAKAIAKDSVEYGLEYGLEDGLEEGLKDGLRYGLSQGASSMLVNAAEEAVGDYMTDEFDSNQKVEKGSCASGEDGSDCHKKRLRKRIIFLLKIVVTLLVLGWIAVRLHDAWAEITKYDWKIHYGWILLSSILYLTAFFPAAVFWFLSLHWMGQSPTFFGAVRAFYTSQLGKYMPGKALVVVIRSSMVAGDKVKLSVAAVSVFYETLTMMATGAFLSALVICIYFREHWFYSLLALGTMFAAGLPVLPPVFIWVVRLLGIGKKDPTLAMHLKKITWRSVLVGAALMTCLWFLFGIGLWAAIQGIGITPGGFMQNMPRYVSVTALAIVLGFAIPIAPGGIGIRETILSLLLIPYFQTILSMPENSSVHVQADNLALIVSLEQRIISILAELSIVALLFIGPAISAIYKRLRKFV